MLSRNNNRRGPDTAPPAITMCEVTSENFSWLLPDILKHISSASFVAFDCEFTALHPDRRPEMRNRLFDTVEQRYRKLSRPQGHSVISQVREATGGALYVLD